MIRGSLSGNFEGYYTFEAELKPDGILWDTYHYEEVEDEDEGKDEGKEYADW